LKPFFLISLSFLQQLRLSLTLSSHQQILYFSGAFGIHKLQLEQLTLAGMKIVKDDSPVFKPGIISLTPVTVMWRSSE
jgi:hypothetical protein